MKTIKRDGKTYQASDSPAAQGDLIRVRNASIDINAGDVFEIKKSSDGDLYFEDNAGDRRYLKMRDAGDYDVFKKTEDDVVTHAGRQYRRTTRKAVEGDLIYVKKNTCFHNFEIGSVQKALGVLEGGAVSDVEGSRFGIIKNDYDVLEPIETNEVKRKANVGERIKIVGAFWTLGMYKNGDILTVDDVTDRGVYVKAVATNGNSNGYINHDEYVVIETSPVGTYVKVVNNSNSHNYKIGSTVKITSKRNPETGSYEAERPDGTIGNWLRLSDTEPSTKDAFTETPKREFRPGDVVKDKTGEVTWQTTLTKRAPEHDDGGYGRAWRHTHDGGWLGEDQFELVESAKDIADVEDVETKRRPQDSRLTVGNYAKVVNMDGAYHNYKIGSIVKIVTDVEDHQPYKGERADGSIGNWLYECEVEPSTKEAFEAQKTPTPRLKVGEYAITLIEKNDTPIGSVVVVVEDDWSGDPFKAVHADAYDASIDPDGYEDDVYDWYEEGELKRIDDPKTLKWAKIGRKVGEIKKGDVVEVVAASCGRNPNGRIGIAYEAGSEGSTRVATVENPTGRSCHACVRLVTPVEQRFDK